MLKLKSPRFTLRTFILGLTAVCIVGCVGSYYVQRSTKQAAATQWVESVGGYVVYDHEINSSKLNEQEWSGNGWAPSPWQNDDATPIGPQFLRDSLGVDYFSTVVGVYIQKPDPPLVDLSQLAQLPNLQLVEIDMSESDDCDFSALATLHEVRRLVISSPALDNLSFLKYWSKLQSIEVGDSQINSIESLSHLKGLERLTIYSAIEDTAPLSNLTALRYVSVKTKDFDVADFKALKNLEEIDLKVPESRFSIPEFEELERYFPTTVINVRSGQFARSSKFYYWDLPAK